MKIWLTCRLIPDHKTIADRVPDFAKELAEGSDEALRSGGPRGRRTAEQRDERAAPHSITSSAATCRVSGTFMLSVFAVFRLMTSSNLVGSRTGNSAGVSPLRSGLGLRDAR